MKYTNEITDFIKSTIEIGGAYVVDEDCFVRDCEGEIVTLNVNNKAKPLMIYNDNMKQGEHCIVNPLVENITNTLERAWYFNTLSRICGGLIHTLMDAIIIKVVAEIENKGDNDFQTLEMFGDVTKHIDRKLIKECEQLKANHIFRIFYSATNHVAQAQTDLDDLEYMEEIGGKVRKRSWAAFQGILTTILDTGLGELSQKFSYKSKHIGFGKTDAMLNLFLMTLEQIHPFVETLLPEMNHYDLTNIIGHMENLKVYNKDCRWFAGGAPKRINDDEPEEVAPWQQPPVQSSQGWGTQPVVQQPQQMFNQPQQMMMQQQPQMEQPTQAVPMPITAMMRPVYQRAGQMTPGYGQPVMLQPQQSQMVMQPYQQQGMVVQQPGMMMQQPVGMMQPYQQHGMVPMGMQQYPQPGMVMQAPQPIDMRPMKPESLQYKNSNKLSYK